MYINELKWYVYPNVDKLISKNKKEQYEKYLKKFSDNLIEVYNNIAHQTDYYCGIKINDDYVVIYRKCAFDDFDRIGTYWWEIKIEDLINYYENYKELIPTLKTIYANRN
jgi:hypothetical protein